MTKIAALLLLAACSDAPYCAERGLVECPVDDEVALCGGGDERPGEAISFARCDTLTGEVVCRTDDFEAYCTTVGGEP